MSNPLKMYHTYSVFVGRIPPNTKKYELRDLFRGCGEIVDVVILEGRDTNHFGFVRYNEKKSALSAVSELNNWSMNGRNIIVALEKHTALKVQQEEAGVPVTVVDGCGQRKRNFQKPAAGKCLGTEYITDTMYWTRLQESCTAVNLKQTDGRHLSMNRLAEDINKMKCERSTLWGSVDDASTSFDEISRKIMQRCRQKASDGDTVGKKNSAEFMCALRTIMKEINEVLESNSVNNVEYMRDEDLEEIEQLTLEGSLVREVSKELEVGNVNERNEVVNSQDEKLEIIDRKPVPKRLSDVGVQTVNEIDHSIIADRKSVNQRFNSSETDDVAVDHVTGHANSDEIAESWYYRAASGGHDDTENEMSHLDPAIIDYHLSKLREIEEAENKGVETEEGAKSRDSEKIDIVKLLHSKVTSKSGKPAVEMERSNSRESSLSEGSNEGNVDDSGVESDCFGISKGRRSFGVVENMLGVNDGALSANMADGGHPKRFLKGSTSEPSLGKFDPQQYVMKSAGRGRGILSADLINKETWRENNYHLSQNHSRSSSTGERNVGIGRGISGAMYNFKMPVGRGRPP